MSDYRAIAGVSSTLQTLLTDFMTAPPDITLAPPDVPVDGKSGKRINLYLYLVAENAYLKNQEIPGQGYPGDYGHPPLSLNLHYLLTAYGEKESSPDSDLMAQQLLGDAMRVLHDFAIITPAMGILDPSLVGEFERIKITMHPSSVEELAKIWTALPKANFRRSASYEVSVVQIESTLPRRRALPVKTRRLRMSVQRRPQITSVYRTPIAPADPIGDPQAAVGQALTIEGSAFRAQKTWVKLGGLEPIGVVPLSDTRIQIIVPDDLYLIDPDHATTRPIPADDQLQPGPQLVQVLTQWDGERVEGGLGPGVSLPDQVQLVSNQGVFMLVPSITTVNPPALDATNLLTVTGTRLYHAPLSSYVLVGDVSILVRVPQGADPWAAPTPTQVQVPLTAVTTAVPPLSSGNHPVRVLVNGALNLTEKLFGVP
jgi:hypothetical protein